MGLGAAICIGYARGIVVSSERVAVEIPSCLDHLAGHLTMVVPTCLPLKLYGTIIANLIFYNRTTSSQLFIMVPRCSNPIRFRRLSEGPFAAHDNVSRVLDK